MVLYCERKLHQQFESYKDQVKKMAEEAQTAPQQIGEAPICGICHKTKFADGCGHLCSYCQTKFCARCGGRVSLRSNKVMWVCNLCRKQQEILTKSGAWFYSGPGSTMPPVVPGVMRRRHEEAPQEKKAKLQEAPLLYQGSTVERSRAPGLLRQHSLDPERGYKLLLHKNLSLPVMNILPSVLLCLLKDFERKRSPSASREPNPNFQREDRPSHYAPGQGGMPRSPSDYGRPYEDAQSARASYRARRGAWHSQEEERHPPEPGLVSERDLHRQDECHTRYRSDPNLARYPVKPQPYEEQMRMHAEMSRFRHERRHSDVSLACTEAEERPGAWRYGHVHTHGPSYGHRPSNPGPRDKTENLLRNDSLSSDQSESVRPPPPRPHKSKRGGKARRASLSSSDEELPTTPEYTSCEDVEIESESVSEKGDSQRGKRETIEQAHILSEGQKKMVRFWGHSLEEDAEWGEPQVKDSGVDTCSSTTLNEEHSHSEKHPVTWQPSKDGDRLIGRILLNKRLKDGSVPRDSGALLGLKVVGGKMTESGRLCAFITKVRKGSLADTVGHLRPGDQVLEWNGRNLQGATFKEVYNIILESKPEPQVELVVSRPIGDIPRIPDSTHTQLESSSSSFESQKMDRPSISITSPMSPGVLRDAPQYLSGQLSVKLWYDKVGHQLIVTILGAKDLPSREDGRPRNPYVKIYFLPDRSDKSKRRTKTVKKSLEPKWNQTFMYSPVHRREFRERMLEITLWDQARVREEESEFLGEILIELETALMDDEPHWYKLQMHDVSSMPLPKSSPYLQRRAIHGDSPTRRLQRSYRISDSEISDYDCEDGVGVISDYRQNGRDLQSSTLSVPEQVLSSNHCSRSVDINRARSRSPSVPPPQRAHPHSGSVQISPTSTPMNSRRGRQLPQLPSKGTLDRKDGREDLEPGPEVTWEDQKHMHNGLVHHNGCPPPRVPPGAMDMEERTRQMKLKVDKYKQEAGSDSRLEQDHRSKASHRVIFSKRTSQPSSVKIDSRFPSILTALFKLTTIKSTAHSQHSGRDGKLGMDSLSAKSSDSDVSDVSAVSRSSSASRFSSASYMSVQSERPRGNRKISKTMQGRSLSREGDELSGEVLHEEEEGGVGNDCGSSRKAKTYRVDREAESFEEAAQRRFSDNDLRHCQNVGS
ncbi:hypothetical protein QTP70_010609 [Hemibagrus guttatus]|uniref:Regulating synaptic membrane exocytosis 2 n=1 Tax=Hemibagrus guttatus TaxID=175788 RepID=A0AAE0Q816_9TELE|nr:hypothetical protein QTP70_010609 [Hemibagrus guttatus]